MKKHVSVALADAVSPGAISEGLRRSGSESGRRGDRGGRTAFGVRKSALKARKR
jgi:hypothetical protein